MNNFSKSPSSHFSTLTSPTSASSTAKADPYFISSVVSTSATSFFNSTPSAREGFVRRSILTDAVNTTDTQAVAYNRSVFLHAPVSSTCTWSITQRGTIVYASLVCSISSDPVVSIPPVPVSATAVYITQVNLVLIPSTLFATSPNLFYLFIQNTNITTLAPELFVNTYQLETVDLSNNQISSLPANLFSSIGIAGNIYSIAFGHNLLTTIPSNLFTGLFSLNEIDLSYNFFTSLPVGLFSGLAQLSLLSVLHDLFSYRNCQRD